jgi:hypothetical protein
MRRGGGASCAKTITLAHGVHESFAMIEGLG